MPAVLFYRKNLTEAQRNLRQLQKTLDRSESDRISFMLELMAISIRLNQKTSLTSGNKRGILNAKSAIEVDLFQQDIINFFKALFANECRFLIVGGLLSMPMGLAVLQAIWTCG
ncbi:MAG: hypothetical protein R2822_10975 [Spirosomataceae bacterium]